MPRDLLKQMVASSVFVNGLHIPVSAVQSRLSRHVVNLAVWNHDDIYKLSLLGSATPILYRNRALLVCCRHQIREAVKEDVCLLAEDGSICITSSGVRYFEENNESDAYDLAVFDFTEPCEEHPEFLRNFYNLAEPPPNTWNENIVALIASGFPSADQVYELEESNSIGLRKRIVTCTIQGQPADPALLEITPTASLDFNPDGLSGGSVFVVQRAGHLFKAYFAGVIARAGKENIYLIKFGAVREFIDMLVPPHR